MKLPELKGIARWYQDWRWRLRWYQVPDIKTPAYAVYTERGTHVADLYKLGPRWTALVYPRKVHMRVLDLVDACHHIVGVVLNWKH